MAKEHIAIVYEGEKTEYGIFENIADNFFPPDKTNVVPIHFPAAGNIYMLWKRLKDDTDQDVIELMRDASPRAKKMLEGLTRDDFSQLFLFFDYDKQAQNTKMTDDTLRKMLALFDNETANGKLYISYPMAEAIRDYRSGDSCDRGCAVDLGIGKEYKNSVGTLKEFTHSKHYDIGKWKKLCLHAIKKAHCVIFGTYSVPASRSYFINEMGQPQIFENQMKVFTPKNIVAVLSPFPLFLLEYFGPTFWNKMVGSGNNADSGLTGQDLLQD